jgi:hypothetical protein
MFSIITIPEFKNLISKSINISFDKVNKSIENSWEGKSKRTSVEVELRLRYLGFTEYQRIVNWLNKSKDNFSEVSSSKTIDYIHKKVRYTVRGDEITAIVKKETVAKSDDVELDTRLSVNIEKSLKIDPDLTHDDVKNQAEYFRIKDRTSYTFQNIIRIDMTEVSSEERGKMKYSYECEIELLKIAETGEVDQTSKDVLSSFLFELMKRRQNSENMYSQHKLRDMIQTLNNNLEQEDSREGLSYKFLAPARNLKYPDIVTGGLIGGKVNYNVAQKVDGVRQFFLVYKGSIWLVYPPHDFNLITTFSGASIKDFMIDGEDVLPENRMASCDIKTNHMYVPFDMVLFNSSNNIQTKPHNIRIKTATDLLNSLKDILSKRAGITIVFKEFKEVGDTFESMSEAVVSTYNNRKSMCYKTDGMIFTPINADYNTGTEKQKIHERVLDKYPDICKLKKWKNLTIDLLIDPAIQMAYGRGFKNEATPFLGSRRNIFSSIENIDWKDEFFVSFKVKGIVEFRPAKKIIDEKIFYYLVPLKARPDKIQSNRTDYAAAIWDDINDALSIETFKGNTFRLLRHSFNKIKKDLYYSIPAGADVFEIGTGQGGQMYRWTRFNKIFGVEPNQKNIDEMNERLSNHDKSESGQPLQPRVKVLNIGGEDTQAIVEGCREWFNWDSNVKPFYIVSMLSLSFFWKDTPTFNGLVSTFQELNKAYKKAGGKEIHFVFMTIRGSPVLRLFNEVASNSDGIKSLTLGPCSMTLLPKEKDQLTPTLKIHIEDTIVDNQEEYLVSLSDLTTYIPLIDLTSKPSNVEICMSESERKYAALFVSGKARVGSSDKNTPIRKMEVERKVNPPSVEETDRIDFRYRGRADFLNSRWLNLNIYHQSTQEKYISDVGEISRETSAYRQGQFGYSEEKEYQALGVLSLDSLGADMANLIRGKDKNGGVVFSLVSLVNAILTCTDPEYQQLSDEIERYTYCSKFYEMGLRNLSKESKYTSPEAQSLNKKVREWLLPKEVESLIYTKLISDKLVTSDEVYYDKNGYFIGEVLYTGDDLIPISSPRGGNLYYISEKKKEISMTDEVKPYLLSEKKIPKKVTQVTRYYKWIGEMKNPTDFINSYSDDILHDILLKVDRINTNSIYYNSNDGKLFRYYHSIGMTLPQVRKELTLFGKLDEEGNEEEYYTDPLQFSFLSDVYGINIKVFSIDKDCLEKDCITDRIYCTARKENSFLTRGENTIYVYYHHLEVNSKGRDNWTVTDLDVKNSPLRGIYVPLGVVDKNSMVKTLFQE